MGDLESFLPIKWNELGFFTLNNHTFTPCIYDALGNEKVHGSFNTVCLSLDACVQSDLSWEKVKQSARSYIEEGLFLFWNIDLGLFNQFAKPLSHSAQFQSLVYSLDYFQKTIWQEFSAHTVGVSLYRGNIDFTENFIWDEGIIGDLLVYLQEHFRDLSHLNKELKTNFNSWSEVKVEKLLHVKEGMQTLRLFCRDIFVDYLNLLVTRLPDSLQVFVFFDSLEKLSQAHVLQVLDFEKFENIHCGVKNGPLSLHLLAWQEGDSQVGFFSRKPLLVSSRKECNVALCLPSTDSSLPSHCGDMEQAISFLSKEKIPFRVISENCLISQCEGIDYVIFIPSELSSQGMRMMQGFSAAEGVPVTLGKKQGFSKEIFFSDFVQITTVKTQLA